MIPLFTKPIEQVTARDLEDLFSEELPEGQTVEFKSTLPAKKGRIDPWIEGKGELGEHARNGVLKEAVAFANSSGGNIVIGIGESDDHPKRAVNLKPLARCHDLADRLRKTARDCIEPQLPSFEVRGILTGGTESGVVLIRVPSSRLAPHRLRPTLHCYIRREDRTEEMVMRDIQDMSVDLARGAKATEQRLEERREQYIGFVAEQGWPHYIAGFRVTVLPVGAKLNIKQVYKQPSLQRLREDIRARTSRGEFDLPLPGKYALPGLPFRPILRGGLRTHHMKNVTVIQELQSDGLTEFVVRISDRHRAIHLPSVLAMAANALLVADLARRLGGAPGAELILDVELRGDSHTPTGLHYDRFRVGGWPEQPEHSVKLGPQALRFPKQSISGCDEIPTALCTLLNDLNNACGYEDEPQFEIDLGPP